MQAIVGLMAQDRFQTRLPADDAERVEKYRSSNEISQAEAVRRLIRAGLDAEFKDGDGGQLERAAQKGTILTAILLTQVATITVLILSVTGVAF